jgi:hypothetical protein
MNPEVKIDLERKKIFTVVEGHEAYIEFQLEGNVLDLQHTFTPRELRGKGIAGKVAEFAFEYAKNNNLKIIPTCPFIPSFLEKNEQYKELLA